MTHYSEIIGWVLLHFIWQATIIAFIYSLIDRKIGRNRANVRCNMAFVALLCMLATSVATLVYEQVRLNDAPIVNVPYSFVSLGASAVYGSRFGALHSFLHSDAAHLLGWVDCAWLIGVLFFAVRALGGVWRLRRLQSTLSFEPADEIAARFSRMLNRMELKGRVSLRIHLAATNPFVVGAFRSIIYLPVSALTSLTPDQIDAILAHELAHVRRSDYAWNLLQTAMETLFFFHPAVWWLGRIIREQRELCCDDIVIESSFTPLTYAKALLILAKRQHVQPGLAMPVDGHQGRKQLFSRVARILGDAGVPEGESYRSIAFRLFIPAVAGSLVLCCSIAISMGAHGSVVHAELSPHIGTDLSVASDSLMAQSIKPNYAVASTPSTRPRRTERIAGQNVSTMPIKSGISNLETYSDLPLNSDSAVVRHVQSEQSPHTANHQAHEHHHDHQTHGHHHNHSHIA